MSVAVSQQSLFIGAASIFVLALAVSIWRGVRRARPIGKLLRTASRLGAGDLGARASIETEDEIGALGEAIDSFATSMQRHEARARAIFTSMSDGMIATDDFGRVDTINPAAERLLGVRAGNAIGRPVTEVFIEAGAPGNAWRHDVIELGGDPARAVSIVGAPIAGERAGTVYLVRNVTREHELERMKSEFLSNISHELRTPLTPIVGYAEMLSRQTYPAKQSQGFAKSILESARSLERVTDTLVSFAAIEGGMHDSITEPLDAAAIARQAAERWSAKGSDVVVRVRARTPHVRGNGRMLARALDELIGNALKFSEGARVTVSVALVGSGAARTVRFAIRDTGVGIEPATLEVVRGAFRQADASERRKFGGLGLGLTLADRVVRLHGGVILVSSRPGKGSVFSMVLPAPVGARAEVTADSSSDSRAGR